MRQANITLCITFLACMCIRHWHWHEISPILAHGTKQGAFLLTLATKKGIG